MTKFEFDAVIEEGDTEVRIVEVPADLENAFTANPVAKEVFEKMAYTYRKEYVRWINDAKRAETRERRLKRTVEKLLLGERL